MKRPRIGTRNDFRGLERNRSQIYCDKWKALVGKGNLIESKALGVYRGIQALGLDQASDRTMGSLWNPFPGVSIDQL